MNHYESPHLAVRTTNAGLAAAFAMAVVLGLPGLAAADEDSVVAGQRVWAEKAQCVECHGWAGNGDRTALHSAGQAPSLRVTQLTRDQLRTTIQCGRPGTPMPHFDRFAYTDKRCYGMTAEELGDAVPDRGSVTLQAYEVDAVADYVATKIKGAGPVTREECLDYFKANAGSRCETYPQK